MKVSSLIMRLNKLPQDKEVYMSCDEEGNRIYTNIDISRYDMIKGTESYCFFPDETTEIEYKEKI